jgi:cytoskeletal protein CcmA (bactofilin family)
MAKKDESSKVPDRAAGREAGLSVVATGTRITGQVDTSGVVKIEGTVAGSVRAERQVLVAKGGVVEGDIYTREAVVGGTVTGAIFSDERVEVQSTAQIHGDITTKRILLQEGGEVNGNLKMEDPKALEQKSGSVSGPGGSSPQGQEESWKQPMAGAPRL